MRSKPGLGKLLAAPSSLADGCWSSSDEAQDIGTLHTPELSCELKCTCLPSGNGMLL